METEKNSNLLTLLNFTNNLYLVLKILNFNVVKSSKMCIVLYSSCKYVKKELYLFWDFLLTIKK